jgi:enoyl-CoA hydratase/carnithine racemase
MHQVTNRLYANDNQLTVSFINGPAFGGGSELATGNVWILQSTS